MSKARRRRASRRAQQNVRCATGYAGRTWHTGLPHRVSLCSDKGDRGGGVAHLCPATRQLVIPSTLSAFGASLYPCSIVRGSRSLSSPSSSILPLLLTFKQKPCSALGWHPPRAEGARARRRRPIRQPEHSRASMQYYTDSATPSCSVILLSATRLPAAAAATEVALTLLQARSRSTADTTETRPSKQASPQQAWREKSSSGLIRQRQ